MKHKMSWTFEEIEGKAPWEREIYIQLFLEDLKKQEEEQQQNR
jgi:hypothetical protein